MGGKFNSLDAKHDVRVLVPSVKQSQIPEQVVGARKIVDGAIAFFRFRIPQSLDATPDGQNVQNQQVVGSVQDVGYATEARVVVTNDFVLDFLVEFQAAELFSPSVHNRQLDMEHHFGTTWTVQAIPSHFSPLLQMKGLSSMTKLTVESSSMLTVNKAVEVVQTVVEQPLVPEVLESRQPSDSDAPTVQNTPTDSAGIAARLISYYNKLTWHSMARLQKERKSPLIPSEEDEFVEQQVEGGEPTTDESADETAEHEEEHRRHERHTGTYETELVVPADGPFFNETLETELTVSAECQCGDQGLHHVVESDEEESTSLRYQRYDYAQHSSSADSRHGDHSEAAEAGELVHCSCDGFEPFDLLSECIDTDRLESSECTYQREQLAETKVKERTRQQRGRPGPVSIKFHLKVNKHSCSQSTGRTDTSKVNLVWQPKAKKHSRVSDATPSAHGRN